MVGAAGGAHALADTVDAPSPPPLLFPLFPLLPLVLPLLPALFPDLRLWLLPMFGPFCAILVKFFSSLFGLLLLLPPLPLALPPDPSARLAAILFVPEAEDGLDCISRPALFAGPELGASLEIFSGCSSLTMLIFTMN
jgi:hypothetical protein